MCSGRGLHPRSGFDPDCKMATLQEPSHGKQKEGSSGPVKKTIALKLKNSKKEEGEP